VTKDEREIVTALKGAARAAGDRVMARRGKHVPQREQAEREQVQARQVERAVEAAEHYRYLKQKFGPRRPR
jgi:hypothetical protein